MLLVATFPGNHAPIAFYGMTFALVGMSSSFPGPRAMVGV